MSTPYFFFYYNTFLMVLIKNHGNTYKNARGIENKERGGKRLLFLLLLHGFSPVQKERLFALRDRDDTPLGCRLCSIFSIKRMYLLQNSLGFVDYHYRSLWSIANIIVSNKQCSYCFCAEVGEDSFISG